MKELKEFKEELVKLGAKEQSAKLYDEVVHRNFKITFIKKLKEMKKEKVETFLDQFERFFDHLVGHYELVEGKNTNYLIQLLHYDELRPHVDKAEAEENYEPKHSPIIISKKNGEIIWD